MDPSIETSAVLTDDQVFDFTQNLRRKFVDTVTENGTSLPTDPKEAKVFLSALADMDKIALGKKRLRSEEEINKHSAQAIAELAATVQRALQSSQRVDDAEPRTVPVLDDANMEPLVLAPGETLVGNDTIDYESFEQRIKEQ